MTTVHLAGSLKTLRLLVFGKIERGGLAPVAHLQSLEELTVKGLKCEYGELDMWQNSIMSSCLRSFTLNQ